MQLAIRQVRATVPTVTELRASRPPGRGRRYSWLEDYLVRLDGKETRREYYARWEQVESPIRNNRACCFVKRQSFPVQTPSSGAQANPQAMVNRIF
jgi:hypothetical protein